MTESVPNGVPLVGLQMDSETAQYVGMLEGTIAALVVNECKYRTLLELLTGDSWEATKVDTNPNALMALAVSSLVRQTGIDPIKAKTLISQRWAQQNEPVSTVVPQAIPVNQMINSESKPVLKQTMQERFSSWKRKQLEAVETLETSPLVAKYNVDNSTNPPHLVPKVGGSDPAA